MTGGRTKLPNRRPCETHVIEVEGQPFTLSFGRDPQTGDVLEVFICGPKIGSHMDAVLDDASILVSRCLQAGMPASELRRSMSRMPRYLAGPATEPASPIGVALFLLDDLIREGGQP